MNITLSADESLIEKARMYAGKHKKSLNEMIRDYLKHLVNEGDAAQAAREFEQLALNKGGKSPAGYSFRREEIYDRGR
ncbi:MAG: hypothetical protein JW760_12240 [Spirochaetales bacterium]|nr:hypothetical protein [Spirochaetales bacterium]